MKAEHDVLRKKKTMAISEGEGGRGEHHYAVPAGNCRRSPRLFKEKKKTWGKERNPRRSLLL